MTPEAGGYTVECPCGWLRWEGSRKAATEAERVHRVKCAGPKEVIEAAPKRATKATWNDREGSTWIDQM